MMSSEFAAVLSMLGTIVLVILVFVGAYVATKIVGKKYQGLGLSTNDTMELIDRKAIGKDESLLIIRVGEKVILLGATPYYIGKIDELDAQLFPQKKSEIKTDIGVSKTWKDILKQTEKRFRGDVDDESK